MKSIRPEMIIPPLVLYVAFTLTASAQNFKNVAEFDGNNGGNPVGSLTQGADGNYYGATQYGGTYQCGVIPGCGQSSRFLRPAK